MGSDTNIVAVVLLVLILFILFKRHIKRIVITTLYKIIESSWYRFALRPLALAIPSATLACYKFEPLRSKMPGAFFSGVDEYALYIFFGYFIVPIVVGFEEVIREKAPTYEDTLSAKALALLVQAFDYPVELKMSRFLKILKNQTKSLSYSEIFKSITEPDRQLSEIVRAIHIFFDGLQEKNDSSSIVFTTALFRIKDDSSVEVVCLFPESVMPVEELLSDSGSLTANVVRRKATIIIEDIEKEKKSMNCRISKFCQADKGSAIGFPIKNGRIKGVPLVLRITANKPSFFSVKKNETYETVFDHFKKEF